MMKLTHTLVTAVVLFTATSTANAALSQVSLPGGYAVNDTDRNIAWISNGNLAAFNTFGLTYGVNYGNDIYGNPSAIFSNGTMTWGGAQKWIAAMNVANYLGYNDWRLPTTTQPDASCTNHAGASYYGYSCTGSELGHLFYSELGGVAGTSISTTHNANLFLFENFQPYAYWSGTEYATDTNYAWYFATSGGFQGMTAKVSQYVALAVRTGQVSAAPLSSVPVPGAAWLLGSGLLGLVGLGRRRLALR